jgi:LysR family transcriptional regulator (chromosome initiation inhibitor)
MLPPEPTRQDLSRADLGVLLGRYVRALVEGAGGRPLVVFVDDAHLLDVGSATLVHQLALTRSATVLATVRSGELAPDPVVSLWKDGSAERIGIGVLGDAAIEELLVAVLGGPVDTACVRQLVDRCRGNPLFLRELVTGALDAGALLEAGGLWRLAGTLQPTDRLVELVALRLGDLTDPERCVLELLRLGGVLFDIRTEDQDHSTRLLREGVVMRAVTTERAPVPGCRVQPLGVMRYIPVASKVYIKLHLSDGFNVHAVAAAPSLAWNSDDALQDELVRKGFRRHIARPQHFVPTAEGFAAAVRASLGWGMFPDSLAGPHLADGSFVRVSDVHLDVPLFWQCWKLDSPLVQTVTDAVESAAASLRRRRE